MILFLVIFSYSFSMEHIIDLFGLNIFLFGNIYRYKDNTHTY